MRPPEEWGDGKHLFVIFHGVGGRRMGDVFRTVREEFPDGGIVVAPQLGSGWFENFDPLAVVEAVLTAIERVVDSCDAVTIIGYSAGGVLARQLFLSAWGVDRNDPFSGPLNHRRWVSKIRRVVLLAGMNRGWSFAPTTNRLFAGVLRALYAISRATGRSKYLASFKKGAPLITLVRLQWIALMTRSKEARETVIVQLLGTIDDIVSPQDNIDIESAQELLYIEVPESGHDNVLDFSDGARGRIRREKLLQAMRLSREDLIPIAADMSGLKPHCDDSVDHVLFVIHGIRDYGFWTSHVARHVVTAGKRMNIKVAPCTPTYGYFPMLPFILPRTRRHKVEWLMDQYIDAIVRYPKAKHFSYVGHSNGTYLLAGALRRYPAVHFHTAVFAGSVVRPDYDWGPLLEKGRIRRVLNYVATSDWVVAIFPRFLGRWLRMDIGGAGYDGFAHEAANVRYVRGAHPAALRDGHWDEIAAFVLDGTVPPVETRTRSIAMRLLATLAPAIWLGLIAIIVAPVLFQIRRWLRLGTADAWPWSLWTLIYLAWFSVIRFILVRL